MPAYGTKSEPPHKAIKDMMAKHSEDSSKDHLHRGVRKRKTKAKRTKQAA
jgi:hypothetical protein